MKIAKLIPILMLCSYISNAQNITGKVLDQKTADPLIGVNIYLKNTKEGTTTNNKGEFVLETKSVPKESDSLSISYVGYITKKITISELNENKNVIYLNIDIHNLKEVSISTNKLLKSRIPYHKLASLKKGLYSFGALLIDDKIYVIGGDLSVQKDMAKNALYKIEYGSVHSLKELMERTPSNFEWQEFNGNLQVYDIKNNHWEILSEPEFEKRAYHNLQLYNNKIYVLGGKRLSSNKIYEYLDDEIEVYDLKKDTLIVDHTNPHQAASFASFIYKDNMIVLGGSNKMSKNGEKEYVDKVHLYDLKTGYWYELGNMPNPKETNGVLIQDKIYLFGGFNLKALNEIETYDLITGEWKHEGNLFRDTERPGLTYNNNIIYVFDNGRISTYNIKTKELCEYLIDIDLQYAELFYKNNTIYILGGFYQDEVSIMPSRDLYSIDVSEFEKTKMNHSNIF